MSVLRIIAIVCIFLAGSAGWALLGAASTLRSEGLDGMLGRSVQQLWGGPLVQQAPQVSVAVPGTGKRRWLVPAASHLQVRLALEHRRKGLLWFPTYAVHFVASYELTNHGRVAERPLFVLPLPDTDATYDALGLAVDGEPVTLQVERSQGLRHKLVIEPGATRTVRVEYRTRGLGEWRYRPARAGLPVDGLDVQVDTDFEAVDFPDGSLSPMRFERSGEGARLRWQASRLLTGADIAVSMPQRLNPGPVAARMSFFAPVGLGFFFVALTSIGLLRRLPIHPMHYLFVTAGFFAFHLLFAYLVDVLDVTLAFVAAALVSLLLVGGYLAAALGPRYPWMLGSAAQFGYLVLFSYSFFLDGMTGLTITIGAVLTLSVLMLLTARLDWNRLLAAPSRSPVRPAAGDEAGQLPPVPAA